MALLKFEYKNYLDKLFTRLLIPAGELIAKSDSCRLRYRKFMLPTSFVSPSSFFFDFQR